MNTDNEEEKGISWNVLLCLFCPLDLYLSAFIRGLLLLRLYAAEADGLAALVRRGILTEGGTARVGAVGPRAAAQHAPLCIGGVAGAAIGGSALVIRVPGVLTPLPDVAVQVVQAPGVRLLAADRRIFPLRVALEPGVILQVGRVVAERIARVRAGAASVLPFRLGW